jgi:predicted GNAT superfamily acetyltransferase
MAATSIVIRLLKDHAEFRQCERLQKDVWGTVAASGEVLFVTQKNGGMILGAFAGKRVVGFIYAFLGRRKGHLIHWSHMMGVEPSYRDRHLGLRMKLVHREHALQQGVHSIAWTYDPLQSRNAVLNLARLGAEIDEYLPDCYGHFPSAIEKGLPSDRLVANWRISSRRVERRLSGDQLAFSRTDLPRVNDTVTNAHGLLTNRRLHLNLTGRRLLLEIPTSTDEMRALDMKLALRWRMEAARLFQRYFALGYRVQDFVAPAPNSDRRAFYLLSRAAAKDTHRSILGAASRSTREL